MAKGGRGEIAFVGQNDLYVAYEHTIKLATAKSLPGFVVQSDLEFLGK